MRFVMFYHSLVSDWRHDNAHFLRGVATELVARGHDVVVYEPRDGWSRHQLRRDHGDGPIRDFVRAYPRLSGKVYEPATIDLDDATAGADVVVVHEWNDPLLVARLGAHRARSGRRYRLLFHDTHHRLVTAPDEMARYDLAGYDGVLASGAVLARLHERRGTRAWTWHEGADTRVFRPFATGSFDGDVVWIGDWGDDERSREILEMLIEPVRRLRVRARVYGVRFPQAAQRELQRAGIEYAGWLASFRIPQVLSRFRLTVHIPPRRSREALDGVPGIRVFEALACGIPLVSLHWNDSERLFRPGLDYLEVASGGEMTRAMARVLQDRLLADNLGGEGRHTVLERHTCAHRVDDLMHILRTIEREEAFGRTSHDAAS